MIVNLLGGQSKTSIMIVGALYSNFAALISCILLYKITQNILSENYAYYSALLFTFNHASPYYNSYYSESTFTMLTFLAIYTLYYRYSFGCFTNN